MPSQRTAITLTEEEQAKFLEDGWTLQVASIGPSGWPHLAAMWYRVINGLVHFTTYAKSQKILNLKRDPRVTCMLEAGKDYADLQGLVIQGDAEVIDDDPELTLEVMQAVNAKYPNSPMAQAPLEQVRKMATKRATVRIHPKRIYTWDHTKLSGRY